MKMYFAWKPVFLIFLTPSISISRMHNLPWLITEFTAFLLKKRKFSAVKKIMPTTVPQNNSQALLEFKNYIINNFSIVKYENHN